MLYVVCNMLAAAAPASVTSSLHYAIHVVCNVMTHTACCLLPRAAATANRVLRNLAELLYQFVDKFSPKWDSFVGEDWALYQNTELIQRQHNYCIVKRPQ